MPNLNRPWVWGGTVALTLLACGGPSQPSGPPKIPTGSIMVTTGNGLAMYLVDATDSSRFSVPPIYSLISASLARRLPSGEIVGLALPGSDERAVRILDPTTAQVQTEYSLGAVLGSAFLLAPDTDRLWLEGSNVDGTGYNGIVELDRGDGSTTTLLNHGPAGGRDFQFDLERNRMHFLSGGDGATTVRTLEIGRPASEAVVIELPEPCEIITDLAMLPDGSSLIVACFAYRGSHGSTKLVPVALEGSQPLTIPEIFAEQVIPSPDGRHLAYVGIFDKWIWLLRLSDGSTWPLVTDIQSPRLHDWQ